MTHSVTKAALSAVLSAAVAIPALAAENTQDENNIVPRMWWDCKGVFAGEHSKGSSDSNDIINKRIAAGGGWDSFTRYRDDARGAVYLDHAAIASYEYPWFRIGDTIKDGRDWSIVFTARGSQRASAMLALGHTNNPTNYVLSVNSGGGATLSLQEKNNEPQALVSTTGVDAGFRFHTYIITYAHASGTMALWADGIKQGEYAGLSSHGGNTEVNFGRDMSTGSRISSVNNANDLGMAVADFRVYTEKMLADTEIAAIASANPVWPAAAVAALPRVRLNCNGAFQGTYLGEGGINDFYKIPNTWCQSPGGPTNAYVFIGTRAGFRAGSSNIGNTDRSWSVVFSGRLGVEKENVALIGLGHQNNANSLVVASAGEGKVKVSLTGDGTPSKTSHTDIIKDVAVSGASTAFHSYALVNDHDSGRLAFYVDGSLKGTYDSYTAAVAGNEFCLGQSNSTGSGGFLTAFGTAVDDFRIYNEVLTSDQIAGYAAEFPVVEMADSDVTLSPGATIELTLTGTASPVNVDSLALSGAAEIKATISGTVDTTTPYEVVSSASELDVSNLAVTLTNSGYEYTTYLSDDGKKLMLLVMPNPTAKVEFNNGTSMAIGSSDEEWYGKQTNEPESTYVHADSDDGMAVLISSTVVPYYKGLYGQQKADNDNGWTLALNVRSVSDENRIIFGAGYCNSETPYTWGLVSDGSDKIKFCQWNSGNNWQVVATGEIPVPEATNRFHQIVLVHGANTVNTENSIIAYVDGVEAARGNFYTHVLGEGKNNDAGNNIAVGGLARWMGDNTDVAESYGNGFKRGDDVAVNDLRFYNVPLSEKQVACLFEKVPAWPEMVTVKNGETLDIAAGAIWTDKMLKLEAGATLNMGTTGGIALQRSLYDLGQMLFLPSAGTVTIALADVEGQTADEPYTLIDDVRALEEGDSAKFIMDRAGQSDWLNPRLKIVDGDLIDILRKTGLLIIVR